MNLRQLGVLSKLFDEIKGKIDDDILSYEFARDGLQTILGGRKILPVGQCRSGRSLLLRKTFEVGGCPESEKLELCRSEQRRRIRTDCFKGYEEIDLFLGPFFTEVNSPVTNSGICAVFESIRRLSLLECAQELLDTEISDEEILGQKLIQNGISFSIKQVVNILKDDLVCADRRGIIFFVHNEDNEIGIAFMSYLKQILYGKSLNDNYAYAKGAQIVSRTIPPHLQSQ